MALRMGHRTILSVPLLRGDEAIGCLTVRRTEVRPFTDKQITLVTTFADQAVIAIENARLLNELRESLEQQTATAEVLRVISGSPGDLAPVFNVMLNNAMRICEAKFATLALCEDDAFESPHSAICHQHSPKPLAATQSFARRLRIPWAASHVLCKSSTSPT